MEFIARTGPTRRAVVMGGIATGALTAVGPAWGQAGAAWAAGVTDMPPAPRDDTVDILYGVTVPDPYRPLEDSTRADVKAWIEAEDQRARGLVDSLPVRKQVHDFILAALDYPRTTIPARYGSRYFTLFSEGLANQRSLGVQEHPGGPRRTLIDAGALSSDGTVTIAAAFSDRLGTKVAYLLSEAGSDRETLHIRDSKPARICPTSSPGANTPPWRGPVTDAASITPAIPATTSRPTGIGAARSCASIASANRNPPTVSCSARRGRAIFTFR